MVLSGGGFHLSSLMLVGREASLLNAGFLTDWKVFIFLEDTRGERKRIIIGLK